MKAIAEEVTYKESPLNPLNMSTRQIEQWVNDWRDEEKAMGHILDKPAPCLLTSAYAQDVVNGYQIANKWVKLACKRFLKDMERSQDDPDFAWKFDERLAYRPIRFIENYTVASKGAIRHLVMQPWQHFVVGNLFGWVHKKTGVRRFREALLFMSRKNGRVLPL